MVQYLQTQSQGPSFLAQFRSELLEAAQQAIQRRFTKQMAQWNAEREEVVNARELAEELAKEKRGEKRAWEKALWQRGKQEEDIGRAEQFELGKEERGAERALGKEEREAGRELGKEERETEWEKEKEWTKEDQWRRTLVETMRQHDIVTDLQDRKFDLEKRELDFSIKAEQEELDLARERLAFDKAKPVSGTEIRARRDQEYQEEQRRRSVLEPYDQQAEILDKTIANEGGANEGTKLAREGILEAKAHHRVVVELLGKAAKSAKLNIEQLAGLYLSASEEELAGFAETLSKILGETITPAELKTICQVIRYGRI